MPVGKPAIFRSVKWGMVQIDGSISKRFEVMKSLGYDGIELISPLGKLDVKELLKASEEHDLPIHGVVDMVHWAKTHRLSSPDEAVRKRGTQALEQALRDAHALRGSSVLLVPGRVTNDETENHDQVWHRSQAAIRKVLPTAARLGVRILIENVWNGFCYQPELLARYLDELESPWVGSYFDIGNHVKYGPSEHWIRTLGQRIVKLDVKDWGEKGGFCKIGDGDCNWSEVRKALAEIGFTGWCTAEVGGGGGDRMADVKARMDRVLGLG